MARKLLIILLLVSTAALALVTLATQFGHFHWFPALFDHFRLHLALSGIVLVLLAVMLKREFKTVVAGVIALLMSAHHVYTIFPYWDFGNFGGESTAHASPGAFKIVSLNIGKHNVDLNKVSSFIRAESPDVLTLIELDDREFAGIKTDLDGYHRIIEQENDSGFNIAIFSKRPFKSTQVWRHNNDPFPGLHAEITVNDVPLHVVTVHPPPPIGKRWSEAQKGLFKVIRSKLAALNSEQLILVGDFNATPWSINIKDMIKDTGLNQAITYAPTWPDQLGVFGIPIDHAMVTDSTNVSSHRIGPSVGSDHKPIILELN